jgi:hypothetical protein
MGEDDRIGSKFGGEQPPRPVPRVLHGSFSNHNRICVRCTLSDRAVGIVVRNRHRARLTAFDARSFAGCRAGP